MIEINHIFAPKYNTNLKMKTLIKNSLLLLLLAVISSCSKNKQNTSFITDKESTKILKDTSLSLSEADKSSQSDTLIFQWNSHMCSITGYYTTGYWTEEELQNTLDLWHKLDYAFIGAVNVFYPQNITEIDTPKLTKEYNELIAYINKCKIIDHPFWQNWKETEIKNITMRYELTKMKGEAFYNPSVLLNNKYIDKDSDCYKYAIALNSDEETILKTWEEWIQESKKSNGDPEAYVQRFWEKYNSPDRMTYAQIDLITFGWWNCVNKYIQYPDNDKLNNEFEQLFIRTEYDCEEP